jgi:ATP:corrinoid adenosyltransferase
MHLVLTGRKRPSKIIKRVHTTTEMPDIGRACQEDIEPQ